MTMGDNRGHDVVEACFFMHREQISGMGTSPGIRGCRLWKVLDLRLPQVEQVCSMIYVRRKCEFLTLCEKLSLLVH